MPDKGTDLGADLYRLWQAGRDNLPSVAKVFADANNHVASTSSAGATPFIRSAEFGSGATGPIYPAWTALRDQLQTILGRTADNLEQTGQALCLAATEYAKTDIDAANELSRQKTDNGDPAPVTVPASRYP